MRRDGATFSPNLVAAKAGEAGGRKLRSSKHRRCVALIAICISLFSSLVTVCCFSFSFAVSCFSLSNLSMWYLFLSLFLSEFNRLIPPCTYLAVGVFPSTAVSYVFACACLLPIYVSIYLFICIYIFDIHFCLQNQPIYLIFPAIFCLISLSVWLCNKPNLTLYPVYLRAMLGTSFWAGNVPLKWLPHGSSTLMSESNSSSLSSLSI